MDYTELSLILDCFGDQKAIKNTKTYTIWLEMIVKVLNMLIELKGNNYYSKVFKRVNYKVQNSTFWVVITPPNRHIASPLAMKERKSKLKSNILRSCLSLQKILSGMMIKLSHGTLKKYNLKFQQELSNTLLITIHKEKALCKLKL